MICSLYLCCAFSVFENRLSSRVHYQHCNRTIKSVDRFRTNSASHSSGRTALRRIKMKIANTWLHLSPDQMLEICSFTVDADTKIQEGSQVISFSVKLLHQDTTDGWSRPSPLPQLHFVMLLQEGSCASLRSTSLQKLGNGRVRGILVTVRHFSPRQVWGFPFGRVGIKAIQGISFSHPLSTLFACGLMINHCKTKRVLEGTLIISNLSNVFSG
jgi:hypothetical protein